MGYDRGDVWWGPAPHKSSPSYRPWVIISDTTHPFSHTECIVLALTTQQHAAGIKVPTTAWVQGGSEKPSYISPWYITTIKYRDFDRQQGTLAQHIIAATVEDLHGYTPLPDS
ncbi:type II toxin-antitoxin system PemK/MazF family toxin [Halocatena marina]|uniref:type II toxin-antitoxin system PemK/MazF family toxin n=1 Tax=Halocatena marina TaxID=2934937 RepID=UPI0024145A0A|nr:type II toxin-antitoxin system PemK/MazF family toxin [Halocatena marina]